MAMSKPAVAPAPAPLEVESKHDEARELAFAQSVHALRITLRATPGGWALVAWLVQGFVPWPRVLLWTGIFAAVWVVNLLILRSIERQGASIARHHKRLLAVAVMDGICWGLMVLLLMTYDRFLDSWLTVVFCGIASINLPTYIAYPPAFRALVSAMWLAASSSVLVHGQNMHAKAQLVVGLLAYFFFLHYTVNTISRRVVEGMRLQLENAALAEELKITLRQVERQATTDALTGQLNRRALDVLLQRSAHEAEGRGVHFSILMLDVDHFKQINDTHGHPVGDQALRAVADRVAAQLRAGDSCARYGGEEFVVLLPGTSIDQACEAAERIRAALAGAALETTPPLKVTASIGVAEYLPGMQVEGVLAAADGAVYVAKRSGRNQVRSGTQAAGSDATAVPAGTSEGTSAGVH